MLSKCCQKIIGTSFTLATKTEIELLEINNITLMLLKTQYLSNFAMKIDKF